MQLDKYLVSFVVFTLIFLAGSLMIVDINDNYSSSGVSMNATLFSNTYNTTGEIFKIAQDSKAFTLGGDTDKSTVDFLFSGSYSAIRLIAGTFNLAGDIFTDIVGIIGLPRYFVVAFNTILIIAVIFSLIYLVFRFKS